MLTNFPLSPLAIAANTSHRKCDETKPFCNNCTSTNRECLGYKMNIMFNTDGQVLKDVFPSQKRQRRHLTASNTPSMYSSSLMETTLSTISNASTRESTAGSGTVGTKKSPVNSLPSSAPTVEHVDQSTALIQTQPAHLQQMQMQPHESPERISSEVNLKIFENLDLFFSTPGLSSGEAAVRSPLTLLFDDLLTDTTLKKDSGPPLEPDAKIDVEQGISPHSRPGPETNPSLESPEDKSPIPKELAKLIGLNTVFDGHVDVTDNRKRALNMSYQEENRMLKHFFKKLLPLLDAHPRSPWPDLALRYCDFDVARSCFISLACIHIYESREGGSEYYKQGIAHIHSTMNHLIQSISSADTGLGEDSTTAANIRSFVIIVLVNVHILFAVLEKGKLSLARYLLKVFASLCHGQEFYDSLKDNENKLSLVSVLSWYDTVSAIVSPDCRLPYCSPDWYGTVNDAFSTLEMMGCPGEIFKAMLEVCYLRHEIKGGYMEDGERFEAELQRVKSQLINYRDYVKYEGAQDYALQLKGAQCWALAVYVSLLRLFKTEERQTAITAAVNEFIDIYGSMPSESPTVTQMVWPVYAIGCECVSSTERAALHRYMVKLYETAQMGTLMLLRWIVEQVWERGITQEEVLSLWLEDQVDYLPL